MGAGGEWRDGTSERSSAAAHGASMTGGESGRPISPEVLAILACPVADCRGRLSMDDDSLRCASCGRRYRLERSWPVLIPELAEPPAAARERT